LVKKDEKHNSKKDNLMKKIKDSLMNNKPVVTTLEFYEFIKLIGKGNYGKVYLARSIILDTFVAIKQIPKTKILEKDLKRKFLQEIAILKEMEHVNIVKIYEVFENNVHIFIVMEYVDKGDLLSIMKTSGRFKEQNWRDILKQLGSCLAYLASRKVLHRDIKFDNILLNTKGEIKLCDFGVSHVFQQTNSVQELMGTPAYLAPEIISRQPYSGFLSDIWSVGVTSYIALTGKIPFKGDTIEDIRERIINTQVEFPASSCTYLSPEIRQLILKMLIKDPHLRASIKDFEIFFGEGFVTSSEAKQATFDIKKMDQLSQIGIPKFLVKKVIQQKQLNHIHALYLML